MTYFYYQASKQMQPRISKETIDLWSRYADKANWRITELPNGYYQAEFDNDGEWTDITRRETIEGTERAIDSSIEHYKRKLKLAEGPVVVKTFKNESEQET